MKPRCHRCGRFAPRVSECTVEIFDVRGERLSTTRTYTCNACQHPSDDEIEEAHSKLVTVVV